MDITASSDQPAPDQVLVVVADWAIDPYEVIAACRRRAASKPQVTFGLLVPAWLHGLDWAGDPYASRACAARQLETLERLATHAGLHLAVAEVGDPDPGSAIEDVRAEFAASEIMLFARPRQLRHPFDLVSRIGRSAQLPIDEIPIRATSSIRERRGWRVLRAGGHCPHDLPHAA